MNDILTIKVYSDEAITIINIHEPENMWISMTEFFIMTGSKKLVDYLKNNIGKQFNMYRMKSKHGKPRLILCHAFIEIGHKYYNVNNYNKYICIGFDKITGEFMMRKMHGKKKLINSKNNLHWNIFG